jgi:AcrR family transcriptional regulator
MSADGIRARVRAELTAEIKRVAREHLASDGAAALSLRAVARELGIASSAIYRYYSSRDELLTALIIDAYNAIGQAAEDAERASRRKDTRKRWTAICMAIRDWAVANPQEYALIYGSPVPGYAAPPDTIAAASRVGITMTSLLRDVEPQQATNAAQPIPPRLRPDLEALAATMGSDISADLMVRGLMAWTYVFGAISFELFGHRHNVIHQSDLFFALEIDRIATLALIP